MTGGQRRPWRVALVGALGHGLKHRRWIYQLELAGRVRLVAVVNRRPVTPAAGAPLDGVARFDDHRTMLARARPDVVVVATPPHTHLAIALDAASACRALLLEKPPVVTTAELGTLTGVLEQHGVVCQVGFQALASPALPLVAAAVRGGSVGAVRAVTLAGAWWRPDSYYRRSPWAGRYRLDGRITADGALANQFAHGLMQCLAVVSAVTGDDTPVAAEVERYRANAQESDDTACLRLAFADGPPITLAVTLAADEFLHGDLVVRGSAGTIDLEFPTDRIRLPGECDRRLVPGRPGLLANLVDHLEDPAVRLAAPLARTAPFVGILDALHSAPAPAVIGPPYLRAHPDGDGQVIDGAGGIVREAAACGALFAELGVPWARPASRLTLTA